jgi:hypothetical protein
MKNFTYLIDKINKASFIYDPFKYIYLENFFTEEDFREITFSKEIFLSEYQTTERLIDSLIEDNYKPQPFPGCTTNISDYLHWFNNRRIVNGIKKDQELLEGFGITMRLQQYKTPILEDLFNFFNSIEWHNCIKQKFEKIEDITSIDTAIQKYLSGYEISPHPDIRQKCLTYMININPSELAEKEDIHTHFMTFNDDKKWIYNFWKDNQNVDRCWVPWSWATTKFKQNKNNSITLFAPSNNTLHGVKLNYNHCKYQRTQFYGNLWYKKNNLKEVNWNYLNSLEEN